MRKILLLILAVEVVNLTKDALEVEKLKLEISKLADEREIRRLKDLK